MNTIFVYLITRVLDTIVSTFMSPLLKILFFLLRQTTSASSLMMHKERAFTTKSRSLVICKIDFSLYELRYL